MQVEVCGGYHCGGCLQCELSQALQLIDQAKKEANGMLLVRRAAEDFVQNVENHLVEGSGEMPLKADRSYRELVKAINGERTCEACNLRTDLANSQMIMGQIVCNECASQGRFAQTMQDLQMGRDWRANSSLSRWFPFTAKEIQEMKNALKQITDLCPPIEPQGGIADSDEWSAEHCSLVKRVGKIARLALSEARGVVCPKCGGYVPGHATGNFDICTC